VWIVDRGSHGAPPTGRSSADLSAGRDTTDAMLAPFPANIGPLRSYSSVFDPAVRVLANKFVGSALKRLMRG